MVRRVLLASPRGYCGGVERAIDTVEAALEQHGVPVRPTRSRGGGAVFVNGEEDVPDGALVVFSAHGVPPEAHVNAAARGLAVVDATTIFLIGHAGHDEIEGTLGEAPAAILRRRFPGLADEGWLEVVDVVGVTSGASAPERLVRSVCAWFAARGVGDIRPHRQVEERVTFRLPALPPAPAAAMSVSRP